MPITEFTAQEDLVSDWINNKPFFCSSDLWLVFTIRDKKKASKTSRTEAFDPSASPMRPGPAYGGSQYPGSQYQASQYPGSQQGGMAAHPGYYQAGYGGHPAYAGHFSPQLLQPPAPVPNAVSAAAGMTAVQANGETVFQ